MGLEIVHYIITFDVAKGNSVERGDTEETLMLRVRLPILTAAALLVMWNYFPINSRMSAHRKINKLK